MERDCYGTEILFCKIKMVKTFNILKFSYSDGSTGTAHFNWVGFMECMLISVEARLEKSQGRPGGSEIKAFAPKPDYLTPAGEGEKKKTSFHRLSLDGHTNAITQAQPYSCKG